MWGTYRIFWSVNEAADRTSGCRLLRYRRRRELIMATELAKQMGVAITGQANLTLVRAYTIGSSKVQSSQENYAR